MSSIHRPATKLALLVCLVFPALFFASCADKIKTSINVYRAMDEGLINSNMAIHDQSEKVLVALQEETTDPKMNEKAQVWYPKAQHIQKLSNDVYVYIEGLKSALKKEAGLKASDRPDSFRENDKNAVIHLFEKKDKAQELYERLKNYKKDVLAIDPLLGVEFSKTIVVTTSTFDGAKEKQDFFRTFFDDTPTAAALGLLSKFQNNVRINENRIITSCYNRIVR